MLRYSDCVDDPELMLNEMLDVAEAEKIRLRRGCVFLLVSCRSEDGTGYGKYDYISRKDLEGREFKVTWADHKPSIEFIDVIFDPRTNTKIPKTVNTN